MTSIASSFTAIRRSACALVMFAVMIALARPCPADDPTPLGPLPQYIAQQKLDVDWKGDWKQLRDHNREQWEKKLGSGSKGRGERQRKLALMTGRMMEQHLERQPRAAGDPEIYRTLADDFAQAGLNGRANQYSRKLVEEFIGRPDIATEALADILRRTPWHDPARSSQGLAWVAYAAGRLLALREVGYLPDSRPEVPLALRAMAEVRLAEGRLADAAELLSAADARAGLDPDAQLTRADLYAQAGARKLAYDLYAEYAGYQHQRPEYRRAIGKQGKADMTVSGVTAVAPQFTTQPHVQMSWDTFARGDRADVLGRVNVMYETDPTGRALVSVDGNRMQSLWTAADHYLQRQPADLLKPLGERDGDRARRAAQAARRSSDPAKRLAVFRRYPWADASHQALVTWGERMLRRGEAELALRAMADVLDHAPNDETRAQAQAGYWLALGQRNDAGHDLAASLDAAPSNRRYPWLGGQATAHQIRRALLDEPAAPHAPRPIDRQRRLKVPAVVAWPFSMLASTPAAAFAGMSGPGLDWQTTPDGGILAAGPAALVRYEPGRDEPAWHRSWRQGAMDRPEGEPRQRDTAHLPGPFRPAVDGDTVYTRWHLNRPQVLPVALAAVDLHTGHTRWSTLDDPAWQDLVPINDPVVRDGRLYILAAAPDAAAQQPRADVYLFCLDRADGRLIWRTPLGAMTMILPRTAAAPDDQVAISPAYFGNPVTIHRGAVYCSTNGGAVARCDVRDGAIEWIRTYQRTYLTDNLGHLAARRGAAPIVVGEAVVFCPRDHSGAFALDRRTGRLRWSRLPAVSHRAFGAADGAALLANDHQLVALDPATGRRRGSHEFAAPSAHTVRRGDLVYHADRHRIERIDPIAGMTTQFTHWSGEASPIDFTITDRAMVAVPDRLEPVDPHDPPPVWRRFGPPGARVMLPPPEASLPDRLFLVTDASIACVRIRPAPEILWHRAIDPGAAHLLWDGPKLLIVYHRRAMRLDTGGGKRLWEIDLPVDARQAVIADGHLIVAEAPLGRGAAGVNTDTGKLAWRDHYAAFGDPTGAWGALSAHGKRFYLFTGKIQDRDVVGMLSCRPNDGQVIDHATTELPDRFFDSMTAAGPWVVITGRQRFHLLHVDRFDKPHDIRSALSKFDWQVPVQLERHGRWLHVVCPRGKHGTQTAVLDTTNPRHSYRADGAGTVIGDLFYQIDKDHLDAVDLQRRQRIWKQRLTREHLQYQSQSLVDLWRDGSDLRIALRATDEAGNHAVLVETRERTKGKVKSVDLIEGAAPYTGDQWMRPFGDSLVIADYRGVIIADLGTRPDSKPADVERVDNDAITIDGALDDWAGAKSIVLSGPKADAATLHLRSDDRMLYIALRYADLTVEPRRTTDRADTDTGDWIELVIRDDKPTRRWIAGVDANGRLAVQKFGAEGDSVIAVRHDLAAMNHIYEIGIPLTTRPTGQRDKQHTPHLRITVWDATATPHARPIAHFHGPVRYKH